MGQFCLLKKIKIKNTAEWVQWTYIWWSFFQSGRTWKPVALQSHPKQYAMQWSYQAGQMASGHSFF